MGTEEAGIFIAGFCRDLSPPSGGKWTPFSDNRSFFGPILLFKAAGMLFV